MSTMAAWEGWEGWEGWRHARDASDPAADRGGSTDWMGRQRSRDFLVFGAPITPTAPLRRWPGEPLAGLSAYARRQVVVMDMLHGYTVKRVAASGSSAAGAPTAVVVRRARLIGSARRPDPAPADCLLVAPQTSQFFSELAAIEGMNRLRPERAPEIFQQLSFNPGFWSGILPLSPGRTRYTLELMSAVVMFSSFIVQQTKLQFNLPRPCELSPRIQPMVDTPAFSTYPSGHATQGALVSALLDRLVSPSLPADWVVEVQDMLRQLGDRIGENREVAGLHFPVDSIAGRMLARCLLDQLVTPADARTGAPAKPCLNDHFKWLWDRAAAEWAA